jgi:hypothetical protein
MKEHNADYLSDDALQWHPRLGIHAANVAPEFGVAETRALIAILENNGLQTLADRFLQAAYSSNKWDKWMLKDTKATDRDRAAYIRSDLAVLRAARAAKPPKASDVSASDARVKTQLRPRLPLTLTT